MGGGYFGARKNEKEKERAIGSWCDQLLICNSPQ
jgi:hypothetical protein